MRRLNRGFLRSVSMQLTFLCLLMLQSWCIEFVAKSKFSSANTPIRVSRYDGYNFDEALNQQRKIATQLEKVYRQKKGKDGLPQIMQELREPFSYPNNSALPRANQGIQQTFPVWLDTSEINPPSTSLPKKEQQKPVRPERTSESKLQLTEGLSELQKAIKNLKQKANELSKKKQDLRRQKDDQYRIRK